MPRRTTSEPMPSLTSKSWKHTTSPHAVTCTSNSTKSTMLVAAFWKDSTVFSRTLLPFTLLAPEPLCLCEQREHCLKSCQPASLWHSPQIPDSACTAEDASPYTIFAADTATELL